MKHFVLLLMFIPAVAHSQNRHDIEKQSEKVCVLLEDSKNLNFLAEAKTVNEFRATAKSLIAYYDNGVTVSYKDAPLGSVGYFYNEDEGKFCSGLLEWGYVVTDRLCLKKIKETNSERTYSKFLIEEDGSKRESNVSRWAESGDIAVGSLSLQLEKIIFSKPEDIIDMLPPRRSNRLYSSVFDKYLGAKGWIIVGWGELNGEEDMYVQGGCELTSRSGMHYSYKCEEDIDYKDGAVVMGNLCGKWSIVGFKSGNQINMINPDDLTPAARELGYSCVFSSIEPCSLTAKKPDIELKTPVLKLSSKKTNEVKPTPLDKLPGISLVDPISVDNFRPLRPLSYNKKPSHRPVSRVKRK